MKQNDITRIQENEGQINSRQIVLRNGQRITIAKAEMSDANRIDEMHERLSRETLYFRYLSPSKPSMRELENLCKLNGENGVVLIATDEVQNGQVVGVACFCLDQDQRCCAEPAILVEDAYQGCGLGKAMMKALYQSAIQLGVKEFQCWTHPANSRVHKMIEKSGMPFERKYYEGMKVIRVKMDSMSVSSLAA